MSDLGAASEFEDVVKLSFFSEIGTAIASARTLEETLKAVMEQIGRVFAPEHWSLLLRDRSTGTLTFTLVTGSAADSLRGRTLPRGKGIAGWIAENAQAVIVSDVSNDPRFDTEMDHVADFETRSIIGVPLVTRDEVFGVIELVNRLDGERFSALDLKVLTTIADFAAIAIERSYYVRILKRYAMTDPLTNVYNRRVFSRQLARESDRVKRRGSNFALLIVDVDDFKSINDQYGHIAGDEVLKRVASTLVAEVRSVDIVARYGGDEFVVLMPDSTIDDAEHVRKRILSAIKSARMEEPVPFSLSIGLDEAGPDTVTDVVERVDAAMYREKRERPEENLSAYLRNLLDLD